MNGQNQELISEYEKFPLPLSLELEDETTELNLVESLRQENPSDQFVHEDDIFAGDEDEESPLTESWSDVSLDDKELALKKEVMGLEEELSEELDMKFNVEQEIITAPQIRTKTPASGKRKFKYQNYEAITARLNYEDLEVLRALRSKIKVTRQQYVKPDGVKRERITENMIIRSLVNCFVRHSLNKQNFNWGQVNTEEDLYKQISKSFKGIAKDGIYPS